MNEKVKVAMRRGEGGECLDWEELNKKLTTP